MKNRVIEKSVKEHHCKLKTLEGEEEREKKATLKSNEVIMAVKKVLT